MKNHLNAYIQLVGGGLGAGISTLINGSTYIADASRPKKPSEI